jgi:hypothetical protein
LYASIQDSRIVRNEWVECAFTELTEKRRSIDATIVIDVAGRPSGAAAIERKAGDQCQYEKKDSTLNQDERTHRTLSTRIGMWNTHIAT